MTSKFSRYFQFVASVAAISLLMMFSSAAAAAAQTANAPSSAGSSTGLPSAPSAPAASAPNTIATGTGTKIGTINIEQAVIGTNEGQRDFEALRKKLEPKQNELKGQNDELENLQKQLQTQGDKLNEDARATLVKQIETKKKSFDRSVQDAQEDAQNQQKEIFQRILQKMAPVIVKHAQEGGYAMIVDTSNPWPQSPILWYGEGGDITRAVVDLYNTQSGVPAPTGAGAPAPAKPASAKPTTPKPAAPKPTTPPQ
jgi:outer membrane protein